MRIGIDISQIVHEGTGVGTYVRELVTALTGLDRSNEYILFGASLRKKRIFDNFYRTIHSENPRVTLKTVSIPPTVLDFLWNVLHIVPVERFIGQIDVFWSSDWTQPPLSGARGLTTIHDLTVLRYPQSFHKKILAVQKRRLHWVKKECREFFCDSLATKKDCMDLLGMNESSLHVVYPGFNEGKV